MSAAETMELFLDEKRSGTARYPSDGWLEQLAGLLEISGRRPRLSWHVCGAESRAVRQGKRELVEPLPRIGFSRLQINGFEAPPSPAFVGMVRATPELEFILQARAVDHLGLVLDAGAELANSSVLFDPSGGRGISGSIVPEVHGRRVGFAGGISPDNVATAFADAERRGFSWIDMETGVRTDDRFDLAKVRSVLETCARLRGAA